MSSDKQTLLDQLARKAKQPEFPALSPEEEKNLATQWMEKRDEKALERLLIDKAGLIIWAVRPVYAVFQDYLTRAEALDFALVGVPAEG